ncbi:substrate-binding domain-containing protein [Fibrobacter sp.]|uniref:substrate-binding domain-containing protein n=1 Tax=Fibrobacter sp. TaxID=35828 RepID=UPI00262DB889|nr:substrate-binding domain-containing protein [Fibrobacter sp.]MDD5941289.1 extracellular solute-binding protein [Fibrobacter sp.]
MKKMALTVCAISLAVMGITAACNGNNEEKNDEAPAAKQMDISVIAREAGSGTRDAFTELVGTLIKQNGKKKDNTTKEAITIDGTQGVMSSVAGNEYAIGYISLGSLNGSVKALDIDGFAPTKENIKAAKYPIARPFNIATKGKMNDAVKDFVDFILSADGQAIIEGNGYIGVSDGKKFQAKKLKGKIVIAGSSSVSPVMEKLKEAYMALNPEMEIEIQTNDSSSGMLAAKEGTCDIGMASRNLKPSELEALTPQTIARDGIAVIVNKQNQISNISLAKLRDIYTGLIRKWNDVK